ncbi:hypothetical protein [Streptomyces sp. PA5.6]|uniref:hypothetical protein n=1 Tax=Streptomyces sp. PA5.6 TaxID=3035651 RepID=UPI003904E027
MAVTQQLARVSAQYLDTCRTSAATSPDGDHRWDPPAVDVLDLDWAPYLIDGAATAIYFEDLARRAHSRTSTEIHARIGLRPFPQ